MAGRGEDSSPHRSRPPTGAGQGSHARRGGPDGSGTHRSQGKIDAAATPRKKESMTSIIIGKRYCGPPNSGNGGYVCGRLASHIPGDAEIMLRAPPPLDKPLD